MIVTGAGSGIGRALALAAAGAGYRVAIVGRRGPRLDDVARSISESGGACVALTGDVTAREMPVRIVDAALRKFGRIDVVVNNAGRGAHGRLLEESDAAIEAQWQLHVAAPLRIARAALAHLQAVGGQLVFIGSGVARVPVPSYGAYALAKAAVRAAAIQLRRELRSQGVSVAYVDPGVVATEFHSAIGLERPRNLAASAESVARAILRGIERRRPVVHAQPWQAAFTALGEWSGTLADPVIAKRFEPLPGHREPDPVEEMPQATTFERALEPVARRMERVKLPADFLRAALVPGATLLLGALAMRWAGMPNKNERAALHEALDALAAAGYLELMEDETWRVVRAAD